MKQEIDRAQRAKGAERRNVKLGRGGIREVEFLAQALQLLYAGDDPWLRGGNTLRTLFRLTERGYLSPGLGPHAGGRPGLPPKRGASAADSPRVPDPHVAGGPARAGPARPPHGDRAAAGRRPAALPRRAPAGHRRRARGLPRVLRGAARPARRDAAPHPHLHRAQGHRLRRSRPRAAEPSPGAGGTAAPAVPRARERGPGPDAAGAARRALAEPRSGRGPQPVRALRVRGGAAHRLAGAPRRPARAAHQPGPALRAGRACHPDAAHPAGAAGQPRRPRHLRRAEERRGSSGSRWPPCWLPRRSRTKGPPAPAQGGGGAARDLAHAARRDGRRALLDRAHRAGPGRAGHRVADGGDGRGAATRRAARRGRPLHRRGDRGGGEARRPRAHHRIRPRPLRDLRPGRHDGRRPAHRGRRLLSSGGGGAAIAPGRHHRGGHRLPGGPAAPTRLQGQHLRGQRRLHGAVLSRVGRPLGAPDAHAGPAGRGGPRRGPPGAPPRERAALRADGGGA